MSALKPHLWLPVHWRRTVRRHWLSVRARGFAPKRISAMMRVKNEATFLRASIESIVDWVDELVVVDNASTDATPQIIAELAARYPGKFRLFQYPHAIARVGAENHTLIQTEEGRRSPHLLSNYYNWCLAKCRMNFVLKWDGDMIATRSFIQRLTEFRRSSFLFMQVWGLNLHPDGAHLVSADAKCEEDIQQRMGQRTTVSNWTSPYTDPEQRLFPRRGARYTNEFWWCESLSTPYDRWFVSTYVEPQGFDFLHLKYCKPDPFGNFSTDFASLIKSGIVPGPAVPADLREQVRRILTQPPPS